MADELTPVPPPAPEPKGKRRHRSGSAAHKPRRSKTGWGKPVALGIFAILVTAGPLAFGAVDTAVQIAVTALLGVGLIAYPPRMIPLPNWVWRVLLALMLILVLKEIAPAWCFGKTSWRTSLTQSYGLKLPWTHHPELGRALDGWLAAIVAITWFAWVRTLAIEREDREKLAWTMLFAAAIVTLVSFATQGIDATMIYGLRPTAGWRGFGPFPNRNHTACFLAIGVVAGSGVLVHAASKKQFGLLAAGCVAAGVALLGLLQTQSRGGLIALAVGAGVYLALIVAKLRTGKSIAIGAAVLALLGTMALIAGARTLGRFGGANVTGDVSVATRVEVWRNALAMWRDAPLFGHGLGAFQSVFPMYQQLSATEVLVKHPESSWLQALTELGFIPVALFVVVLAAFLVPHVRFTFTRRTSFYVRAAALAAVAVLMVHSLFDVPAHRWGTIGLAIAALALACPATGETVALRRGAILPLAITGFWALPLWLDGPPWSTFQLDRLLTRDQTGRVMLSEVDRSLRCFPLTPALHLAAGERLLAARALPPSRWQNEFRIATRLVPGSSQISMNIARLCRPVDSAVALHYWQMAVERAGERRVDAFHLALRETQDIAGALGTWEGYVAAQPDLALVFSEKVPSEQGREYFQLWWKDRGSTGAAIPESEADTFLRLAEQWGTPEQLQHWMAAHEDHRSREYRQWAALLHHWGRDNEAWALLHGQVSEPTFPSFMPKAPRDQLEFRWIHSPADIVNARNYAQLLQAAGDLPGMEAVILAVAEKADAPKWFLEKAAHILARKRDYSGAVEMVLRVPPGSAG